jgi:hypothetical protein
LRTFFFAFIYRNISCSFLPQREEEQERFLCLIQVPCFPAEARRWAQRMPDLLVGWMVPLSPLLTFFFAFIFTAARRREGVIFVFDSSTLFSR